MQHTKYLLRYILEEVDHIHLKIQSYHIAVRQALFQVIRRTNEGLITVKCKYIRKIVRIKGLYGVTTAQLVLLVIVNGDAPALITLVSGGAEAAIPPKTTEQKIARRNELKAKSTLLLAIPDEHLFKFHEIKDAKTLWEAIKTRFGGDKESKKMQKTILKQQYENFAASRSEGRCKSEVAKKSPAWNTHTLIMRNKLDLDTLSMDDLYNNLKVYEAEIKGQSNLSSNSQNVAFVSLDNTSSTNEEVNTAHDVSAANLEQIDTCHRRGHFARECRAPRSQENKNRDITRRVVPVETPAKALVVTDEMGYDWSYQAKEGPTDFTLMAFISSGSSNSDIEVNTCSKECLKSYQTLQKQYDQQRKILNKANLEIIAYQLGLELLEARLVVYQKNEAVFEEDIAFLKSDVKVRDNSITELKNQLEEYLKEKDDLKLKLEKFETSSKNLTNLINSQISLKDKTDLGYDSQLNKRDLNNKSDVLESASDSSVNKSEEDNNQANDSYKIGEGYHTVTPPYAGNFMPLIPDLSFAGLDDSIFKSAVSETVTSVHEIETSASKTSKESMENPKSIRLSAPIIKDYESDSDDDSPKGGKISRKGKVRTWKLDFKDVYFVCLVLSPDFKLLDENQVLLKVPRQNNMYSFDLKNVAPSGGIENQLNHRVKIIRCDNETKFKNSEMNQFCQIKGIKREFSVARTPRQNGVAERKNRTLIEAARTMLADLLLPTTFWAKAVNTSFYVQNRVLVSK
nr:ribonuclease H-like domain-containing protein [Tanacetum cinerariifolium]